MWQAHSSEPQAGVRRTEVHDRHGPLSFDAVIRQWRENAAFQAFWVDTLRSMPFTAYAWETPPLTRSGLDRTFECVFVDHPALAHTCADPRPFEPYLQPDADAATATFENLGGDALLVAPHPKGELAVYSHLAAFARRAPAAQAMALWPAVAAALDARLGDRPCWLSTAGMGVFWLHVRVDARPKYYRYRPYARSFA